MTIPIALFMGFYMRVLRPGRVLEATAIGVTLLLAAIVARQRRGGLELGRRVHAVARDARVVPVAYGFVASILPVWMLLAPRDYLSTFMKIGTIVLLAIGIS